MAANRRFIPLLPLDEADDRPSLVDSSVPVAPSHPIYASVPLRSDRFSKSIRLLALEGQNDPTSQVRVTMFTTDLCNPTVPYRALSYAWIRDTSATILLNGHPFEVSVDLYQCLQALSRHVAAGAHPILWVDAICINQADDIERAAQVTVMSQIYRSCERCIVWLGPEENDSHLVFSLFEGFLDLCRTARAANLNIRQEIKQLCSWDKYGKALELFYKRPYWRRLWIVQEVLLAPRLFLLAGDRNMDGDPFRIFLKYMPLCADDRFFQLTEGEGSSMLRLFDFATVHRAALAFDFIHGLLISRSCKFTDGRDVVYAILGLVDPQQIQEMGIGINYSISTNRLWAETTSQVIRQNKSLNILSICGTVDPAASESAFRAKLNLIEQFWRNPTNDFDTTLAAWSRSEGQAAHGSLCPDRQAMLKVKETWQLLQPQRHQMGELEFKSAVVQAWIPPSRCEPNRLPTWVPNWSDTKSINTHILYGIENGKIIKRNFRASKDTEPSQLTMAHMSLTTFSFHCHKVDSIASVSGSIFGPHVGTKKILREWLSQPALHRLMGSMTLTERATAFVDMVLLRPSQDPILIDSYHELLNIYIESIRITCTAAIKVSTTNLQRIFQMNQADKLEQQVSQCSDSPTSNHASSARTIGAATASRLLASYMTDLKRQIPDVKVQATDMVRNSRETLFRLSNSLDNFQVFFTHAGFIGLAGHTVKKGDIVCIPLGCDVPLLIRPAVPKASDLVEQKGHPQAEYSIRNFKGFYNNTDTCSQSVLELLGPEYQGAERTTTTLENYWLIGESYVAGIMNGEFLDQLDDGEEPEIVTIV